MGVSIVFHHVVNQPHTPSPHFASFPTRTPQFSLYGSFLPAPPQYHEPSISSTISLPIYKPTFISPTSYINSPMGPPPFISLPSTLCPTWATHITLGHSFLYLYISPQLFVIYCTNAFIPSHYIFFLLSPLTTFFLLFDHTQPMSPLVGALLIIYPCRHRPSLQSTPQVTYLYPLSLFTFSHLWHNLSPVLSSP
jgi:hypothetical protein